MEFWPYLLVLTGLSTVTLIQSQVVGSCSMPAAENREIVENSNEGNLLLPQYSILLWKCRAGYKPKNMEYNTETSQSFCMMGNWIWQSADNKPLECTEVGAVVKVCASPVVTSNLVMERINYKDKGFVFGSFVQLSCASSSDTFVGEPANLCDRGADGQLRWLYSWPRCAGAIGTTSKPASQELASKSLIRIQSTRRQSTLDSVTTLDLLSTQSAELGSTTSATTTPTTTTSAIFKNDATTNIPAELNGTCRYPRKPENGDFGRTSINNVDGSVNSTLVIYGCRKGFTIEGSKALMCLDRATWSGPMPTCQADLPPPTPACSAILPSPNSKWNVLRARGDGLFPVGTVVTVTCELGYFLSGANMLTCTEIISQVPRWSENVPTCNKSSCPRPNADSSVAVRFIPQPQKEVYPVGTLVFLSCENGMKLEGDSIISCLSVRQWSSPFPKCKSIATTTTTTTTKVTVGPAMSPTTQTTTTAELAPTCEPFHVPNSLTKYSPELINNNNNDKIPQGTVVSFSCETGFTLAGYVKMLCIGGPLQWSNPSPKCVPQTGTTKSQIRPTEVPQLLDIAFVCPVYFRDPNVIALIVDGTRTSRGYLLGTVVELSCQEGFILKDDKFLLCTDSGWRGTSPSCTRIE